MNLSALLFFLGAAAGARLAWRRGARALAAGCAALVVLFGASLWQTTHPLVLTVLLALAAVFAWHRWGATAATVTRWGALMRRKSGVASGWDIARHASALAMRRRAGTLRPSLQTTGRLARWRQLATLPPTEIAVRLCRVGGQVVWAAVEDVVLIIGGPRKGKTQILAGQVIDAPGAVIATSTRTDLLDQTAPLRAEKGPVYVFNPVGLGDRPSTVTFDPLTGCANPVTAAERATDMLAAGEGYGGRSGDREFWDDQGRRNLGALLHAAALAGDLSMGDVGKWLSDLEGAAPQIIDLLRSRSPEPAFEASVSQFIATNERTRSSITATIAPALSWLTHKPARDAARPDRDGGHPLDVAQLLAQRGSVYMLGGEEAQVAPLVCAMTGWIAREARRLAAHCDNGRLDPPLALRLDECALICKVPLHQWTADMGGRGVSIVACFQSRSQIVDHYGSAKAATIINNAGPKALFGGTGDKEDLQYWSTLAGERDEPITTTDLHGRVASRTTRRVPVLAPAQIHTLPPGRVVVFTSAMPPVIGRAQKAFTRLDVLAQHNPDATMVRARLQAARVARWVAVWAWRHAAPVSLALAGLLVGAPAGGRAAVEAGHAPGWAGGLAGGFLGIAAGLLIGHLLVLGARAARGPGRALLRRHTGPLLARVAVWWAGLRARLTGRGHDTGYQPYSVPEVVPAGMPNAPVGEASGSPARPDDRTP
jgi:type IV secretion system protein VirD4